MWKKDDKIFRNPLLLNGKQIFNPTKEMLKEAGYVWVEPGKVIPTAAQTLRTYEDRVQRHLDSVAKSRGYDNTYTCLSYLSSTDEVWRTEANAFNAWRDQVWRKCHEILNAFMSGLLTQPTPEELIKMLPSIDWGIDDTRQKI